MEVGDPYINFIFSALNNRDGGIEAVEEGYEQFLAAKRQYESEGKRVENPPALFNRCAKAVVENNKFERESKEDL